MPAATSNVVSVSLLSISPVEALQSAGALVSGAMSAFLPPSGTAVESLQSAGAIVAGEFTSVDPFFADVALLLTMDGTEGQTTFTDSSNNNFPMSQSGSTPLVSVDTSNPKFGTGAANYGAVGAGGLNAITTAITAGGPLDLDPLAADFTIEGWVFVPSSSGGGGVISDTQFNGGPFRWAVTVNSPDVNFDYVTSGAALSVTTPGVVQGAYNAFAVVCKSSMVTVYVQGIGGAPVRFNGTPAPTSGTLSVGAAAGAVGTFTGELIDEVRITNGVARYTSNYTPATAPFPTS
jgi:Concanavalin A-like lectin/glucanases superfamily